jgi:hypothetical protein
VEELLRKLLLSAVVVLIDEGSPLQVTLAVLVSGWAHVLHAVYKPWGTGSVLYGLQHGALFVTSFVFLMGLLFKVDGVSSSSGTYTALSGIMVTLCVSFIAAWVAVIVWRVVTLWRASRDGGRRMSKLNVGADAGKRRVDAGASSVLERGHAAARVAALDGGGGDLDSDATAALHGPSDDFVVMNPLRRPKRDVPSVSSLDGGADDVSGAVVSSMQQPSEPASVSAVVGVSRLQRVLAAQQPVLATRVGQSFLEGKS